MFKEIHEAATEGDCDKVLSLLKGHRDFNDPYFYKVIEIAAIHGNDTLVAAVVDAGISPDGAGPRGGTTPLMVAAKYERISTILTLLEKGAQINLQGAGGFTALMKAAEWGRVSAVQTLLGQGADAGLVNHEYQTARMVAEGSFLQLREKYSTPTAADMEKLNQHEKQYQEVIRLLLAAEETSPVLRQGKKQIWIFEDDRTS